MTEADRQADRQADRHADRQADPPDRADDPDAAIVCHCMQVERGRLHAAIRAGAGSVEALQEWTGACTGCGTCRLDLLELLAEVHAGSS